MKPVSLVSFPGPSILFKPPLLDRLRLQDVTVPYKIIGVIDILGPKWPEMLKANLQPWF